MLLLGYKVSAAEIFTIEESDEEGLSCKIKFNSSDYDEQIQKLMMSSKVLLNPKKLFMM